MISIKQFPFHEPRPNARVRLVCLPFAGGAALVYRAWQKAVPDWIEICAYEGSGHGTRIAETPASEMARVIQDIEVGIRKAAEKSGAKKTAIFGHSMGGRVAFSLASKLVPPPIHLFVSACRSPFSAIRMRSDLPREALVAEMKRLGGTPREILDDEEMMTFVLPTMRADFSLVETKLATTPVSFPITAFAGVRDPEVASEDVASWERIATAGFTRIAVDAAHFYLESHRAEIIANVTSTLEKA